MISPAAPLTRDQLAPVPTGDRMCFRVPSRTKAGVDYLVDLEANNLAGFCECPDFFRRQRNLNAGMRPWTKATTCHHLRETGRLVFTQFLKAWAKQ